MSGRMNWRKVTMQDRDRRHWASADGAYTNESEQVIYQRFDEDPDSVCASCHYGIEIKQWYTIGRDDEVSHANIEDCLKARRASSAVQEREILREVARERRPAQSRSAQADSLRQQLEQRRRAQDGQPAH